MISSLPSTVVVVASSCSCVRDVWSDLGVWVCSRFIVCFSVMLVFVFSSDRSVRFGWCGVVDLY